MEWLRKYFEPDIQEKADEERRLLILDGHGSYVTGSFLINCLINKIHIMHLPHISHPLLLLDIGLFGPLKTVLEIVLNPILRKEVSRLQKYERLIDYIEAQENGFTESNVFGGWYGAGLISFDLEEVLQHISPPPLSFTLSQTISGESPISPTQLFENSFITSSPPEASQLRNTTQVLHK